MRCSGRGMYYYICCRLRKGQHDCIYFIMVQISDFREGSIELWLNNYPSIALASVQLIPHYTTACNNVQIQLNALVYIHICIHQHYRKSQAQSNVISEHELRSMQTVADNIYNISDFKEVKPVDQI